MIYTCSFSAWSPAKKKQLFAYCNSKSQIRVDHCLYRDAKTMLQNLILIPSEIVAPRRGMPVRGRGRYKPLATVLGFRLTSKDTEICKDMKKNGDTITIASLDHLLETFIFCTRSTVTFVLHLSGKGMCR